MNKKMTEQDKKLLLEDLCARLPYGVICHTSKGDGYLCDCYIDKIAFRTEYGITISAIEKQYLSDSEQDDAVVKPYLKPMSSMTEEERMEFTKLFDKWHDDELFDYIEEGVEFSIWKHKGISPVVFDWLNIHYFDYRGLIEKGLALIAPEGMYKIE